MSSTLISYIVFTVALCVSVMADFIAMRQNGGIMSVKSALKQFVAWFVLAMLYGVFLYFEFGKNATTFTTYVSAYLVEESLSIDNIFVFIMLFTSFKIKESELGKLLLIGVLMAIVLRLGFIVAGIELIARFNWILYIFGGILIYSGLKLFFKKEDEHEEDVSQSKLAKFLQKNLRVHYNESDTTFTTIHNGKKYFTRIFLAVVLLAFTDIMFAVDSIPAVLSISQDKLIVFSSNVFAILGLRPLFFVLRSAADKFDYLQQGIACVLVFIGIKLILSIFHIHIPEWVSLLFITTCLATSMLISYFYNPIDSEDE
jgi:tellurite resistance protein TerC